MVSSNMGLSGLSVAAWLSHQTPVKWLLPLHLVPPFGMPRNVALNDWWRKGRPTNKTGSFSVCFKLRDEKLQEERTSEDFIHKLIIEDPEAGRRKTEDLKKEDSLVARMTQEHVSSLWLLYLSSSTSSSSRITHVQNRRDSTMFGEVTFRALLWGNRLHGQCTFG